jgi:hypothetical protein
MSLQRSGAPTAERDLRPGGLRSRREAQVAGVVDGLDHHLPGAGRDVRDCRLPASTVAGTVVIVSSEITRLEAARPSYQSSPGAVNLTVAPLRTTSRSAPGGRRCRTAGVWEQDLRQAQCLRRITGPGEEGRLLGP